MATPNLKDLPEELVSNISLRLWSDDVQALRLTCKTLEQKTLHEWATEYFSKKAFIISTDSLKVLQGIADSPKLRPFVHGIHILTAYFTEAAFACGKTCPYGHCLGWNPTIRQREAWKFFCDDQKRLKESGKDKEILTEVFGKLPALVDVSLVDTTGSIRISTDISMFRKVPRLCGRNFQLPSDSKHDPDYHKVLTHTWSILTSAIANSGISTLKCFGTVVGKGGNPLCVPSDIRFSDAKVERLRDSFKNLEKFRVQITSGLPRNASDVRRQTVMKASHKRVENLASTLPALKHLSLDFDALPTDTAIFTTFMQKLDLSNLTKIQLSMLTTTRAFLMTVLDRLESIQDLFMSFIDLSKGSWIPVLKQLQGMDDHLEHLHMMYLSECGKKAYFLAQPDEDEQMAQDDMMFDEMMGHGEDDIDDDDDDTDDELPPLETMDGELVDVDTGTTPSIVPLPAMVEDDEESPTLVSSSNTTGHQSSSVTPVVTELPTSTNTHASSDHKAPGNESYPERGYYVCVQGKETISKQLKTFVQEYNLGEDVDAGAPPMGGLMGGAMGGPMGGAIGGAMTIPVPAGGAPGQPPNMNNIINGLAGYLGLPMPVQNGDGGGGGQAGAHGGSQQGAANINNANAAGGLQAMINMAGQGNGAPQTNNQATAGAAAGPAHGPAPPPHMAAAMGEGGETVQLSFDDVMMGGLPPGGPAGAGHGGAMDEDWATDEESGFESGSDQ